MHLIIWNDFKIGKLALYLLKKKNLEEYSSKSRVRKYVE